MNSMFSRIGTILVTLFALACPGHASAQSTTTSLADQPIFAVAVPGNLVLDLSVEYPTAISVANIGSYDDTQSYLGYFDPAKCYDYIYNSGMEPGSNVAGSASYFQGTAFATGTRMSRSFMPRVVGSG